MVLYVLKTDISWTNLLERFGKFKTIWKRFDRWAKGGVWKRVAMALGDGEMTEAIEELQLDSTSIKTSPTTSTG